MQDETQVPYGSLKVKHPSGKYKNEADLIEQLNKLQIDTDSKNKVEEVKENPTKKPQLDTDDVINLLNRLNLSNEIKQKLSEIKQSNDNNKDKEEYSKNKSEATTKKKKKEKSKENQDKKGKKKDKPIIESKSKAKTAIKASDKPDEKIREKAEDKVDLDTFHILEESKEKSYINLETIPETEEKIEESKNEKLKSEEPQNKDSKKEVKIIDKVTTELSTVPVVELSLISSNLFRSKQDEEFVFKIAPIIMKKLLIKQKGWRSYHNSEVYENHFKYQNSFKFDFENVDKQYNDLMKDKIFSLSFQSDYDKEWLKRWLARPISECDCFGYVYVYYVQDNQTKKVEDKVMPFKIGRSVDWPKRISHSEKENNEKYNVAMIEPSQYYKHFEAIIHDYFRDERIIRDEITDGKTEWFYKKFSDIEKLIRKCKIYLKVVRKDKGEPAEK